MKILLYIISAILLLWLFSKRSDILCLYGRRTFYTGKQEKALKIFRFAEKIGKFSPQNNMQYGYIFLRIGDLDNARKYLTLATFGARNSVFKNRVRTILALVSWKEGNLDGAIEMLEDIIDGYKNTTIYQNLGLMYVLKGDSEKALEFNLEAYDYNSDDLIICDNLAESYVLSGNFDEASKLYEKILESEPHFPEPYYSYGALLCDMGEKDRGIELIRQSLTKRFSFLSEKTKDEVEKLLEEKLSL